MPFTVREQHLLEQLQLRPVPVEIWWDEMEVRGSSDQDDWSTDPDDDDDDEDTTSSEEDGMQMGGEMPIDQDEEG